MIYRRLGATNIALSQLGFGCMRFPLKDKMDPTTIDAKKTTKMLFYAIDKGVNILDNAYPYHRQTSEQFVGRVLPDRYRRKIYLSTKMPMWLVKSRDDPEKYFNEQLARLQTDRIEFYLLHSLAKKSWQSVKDHGVLSFLEAIKAKGKIGYAGFSFHDELSLFKEIVDAYPWTFCLIHLNYVDDRFQAGIEGLEYAHRRGLAIMVMEPLRGGKLALNVPRQIKEIIKETGREQTPAQFALRWLYNRSDICCVLSGMNTLEQLKENLAFAAQEHVGTLTPEELALYSKARDVYKARIKVTCTQCGYCTPCPQNIPIPFILELYNDAYMYNAFDESRMAYSVFIRPEARADQCTECCECADRCPQKISISETLKEAHQILAAS